MRSKVRLIVIYYLLNTLKTTNPLGEPWGDAVITVFFADYSLSQLSP